MASWPFRFRRSSRKLGAARKPWPGVTIAVSPLEDRTLPRPTLYLEFGDNFPNSVLTDTVGNFQSLKSGSNPSVNGPGLGAAAASMTFTSYNKVIGSQADAQRAIIVALVKQYYLPTDVEVVELKATPTLLATGESVKGVSTLAEASKLLGANNSSKYHNDTIVFINAIGINGQDQGGGGLLGIASGTDVAGHANNSEGSSLTILDPTAGLSSQNNNSIDVAVTTAHEAGHNFGLQHAYDTSFSGFLGPSADMYARAEIMCYIQPVGAFGEAGAASQSFLRVPTIVGDSNKSYNDVDWGSGNSSFNQYAADPNIGQNPLYEYVTGSGAHDQISITKLNATTAKVSVSPFFASDYTTPITIPGSSGSTYSYDIPINAAKTLLIDAGIGSDQITLDASLGMNVQVRGQDGLDSLIVNGTGAETVSYTPGTNTAKFYDNGYDLQGTLFVNGTNTIKFSEFEPTSTITLQNLAAGGYASTGGPDDVALGLDKAGKPVLTGTFNIPTGGVPLTIGSNVKAYLVDVGQGDTAATVNKVTLNFTNGNPLDKTAAVFQGGIGTDLSPITFDGDFVYGNSGLTLAGSANALVFKAIDTVTLNGGASANKFDLSGYNGAVTVNGAGGADTLMAVKDRNFVLTNALLKASDGLAVTYSNIETVALTGGAGNNTFDMNAYSGTGAFDGGDGTDTVSLTRDTNFTLTNSTIQTDDGSNLTVVNFESVELTGGPSANTFNLQAFSGAAKLDGLSGGDTYIVNPGQAPVTVADSGLDAAIDKLVVFGTPGNDEFTFPPGGVKVNGLGSFITSGIEDVSVDGGAGDDTFVLDLSPGFAKFNVPTITGGLGRDVLAFLGTPAGVGAIALGSVVVTGPSSGRFVLDPDGSGGPAQINDPGLDAFVFTFAGDFEGVLNAVPVARFDVPLTAGDDAATLGTGAPVNGVANLQLLVGGFSVAAANTGRFVVSGLGGSDKITVDLASGVAGIGAVDVYGDRSPDTPGTDDGAADTLGVLQIGSPVSLFGQGGDDTFFVGDPTLSGGGFGTDKINAAVTIDGGPGSNGLILNDYGAAAPNTNVVIDSSGVGGLIGSAGAAVFTSGITSLTVVGANVDLPETYTVNGTNLPLTLLTAGGPDTVTVSAVGSQFVLDTGTGNDTVTYTGVNLGAALLSVALGDGNDAIGFTNSSSDAIIVDAGAGNDSLTLTGSTAKSFQFYAGDGDDSATLDLPGGYFQYYGGAGFDSFSNRGGAIGRLWFDAAADGGSLTLTGGSVAVDVTLGAATGAVAINLANVTVPQVNIATDGSATKLTSTNVVGNIALTAKAGVSTVAVNNLSGSADLNLGDAANNVSLAGVVGTGASVHISAGSGANTVTVAGVNGAADIVLGGGGNAVAVSDAKTVFVTVGGGNDTVSTANSPGSLTTGDGDDTVNVNGTAGGKMAVDTGTGNDAVSLAVGGATTVTTGAGLDTVAVNAAAGPVSVATGDGDDVVSVGGTNLDGITAPVTVDGGAGKDTVALTDTANANPTAYGISDAGVSRGGAASLTFGGVEAFSVLGGSGANAYTVASVPAGGLTVLDGAGGSTFTLPGSLLTAPVDFNAGGGNDTFLLDAAAGIAGDLLTLESGTGTDTVRVTGKPQADRAFLNLDVGSAGVGGYGAFLRAVDTETIDLVGGGGAGLNFGDFTDTALGGVGLRLSLTGPDSGRFTAPGWADTALTYAGFASTAIFGDPDDAGHPDNVTIDAFSGTNGRDVITVTPTLVTVRNAAGFTVEVPISGASALTVNGGDETGLGDDVSVSPNIAVPLTIDGGGGIDRITIPIIGLQNIESEAGGLTKVSQSLDDGYVLYKNFETAPRYDVIAVATGPGTPSRVRVYDAVSNELLFEFAPYADSFLGGVSVATGDVNGDGTADIIVGAGPGGGPHVQVIDGATGDVIRSFFAYEDTFTGGVQVAAGDTDGDGYADLILGTGLGGGPRAQVVSGRTTAVLANFFAYEDSFRNGVQVAAGDIDGDGLTDVVTGSGVGGGPRVRAFRVADGASLADFFAYDDSFRSGVNVAAGDLDGDGLADIVTGPGSTGVPIVKAFTGDGGTLLTQVNLGPDEKTEGPAVRVAVADMDKNGVKDIVTGRGPGEKSLIRGFRVAPGAAEPIYDFDVFAETSEFGVFVG